MNNLNLLTFLYLKNINNIFDANSIVKINNNQYTYNDYYKDVINNYINRSVKNPLQREFGKYLINII